MARTTVRTAQIEDGGVQRDDLNASTVGKSVIKKAVEGTGVQLSSTGADSGTGDVTIATRAASASQEGHITTGAQTLAGAKTYNSQYASARFNAGNSGSGTKTLSWNDSACQLVTMTGNCTFAFNDGIAGGRYLLELLEDATGSRAPSWPASVLWSGGTAPTLSGPNKIDLIVFYFNGTNYLGQFALNY